MEHKELLDILDLTLHYPFASDYILDDIPLHERDEGRGCALTSRIKM